MSEPKDPRRRGPPHNPNLRELVAGKRRWSSPANREHAMLGFRGWHERGYLPHRDQPGFIQFVTIRLHDSFPAALRSEWAALRAIENERERQIALEAYLDKGRGTCHLRRSDLAELVDGAFRFYDKRYYELRAWVVMPNHVHALFQVNTTPLSKIVAQLKQYTARKANGMLKQRGSFWAPDYWDTYMRNAEQEMRTRRYVENNPVKAHFVLDPKRWPWSSARYRDENGKLCLP
jgi:REP element-mobilizing transposase RayT